MNEIETVVINEGQKEFYDYAEQFWLTFYRERYMPFIKELAAHKNPTILDVGGGGGIFLDFYAIRSVLSEKMIFA